MSKKISLVFILILLSSAIIYSKTVDVYDIKGMLVMTTDIASDYTLPLFTSVPSLHSRQMSNDLQSLPHGIYIIQDKKLESIIDDIPRLNPFFRDVTGTFMPTEEYFAGSIAAADFNNDGYDDIVFFMEIQSQSEQNQPHIYMHQPDGSYLDETATRLPVFQEGGFNLLTVDIDQDSDQDILFISYFYGANTTNHLFLNDGTGVFNLADSTFFPRIYADDVKVFDVNEDGYPDLLYNVNNPVTNMISRQLWVNHGTHFAQDTQNRLPAIYNSFLWGEVGLIDINHDSHLDIICSNTVENIVCYYTFEFVLLNTGDGHFIIPNINPLHTEITSSVVTHIVPIDYDHDDDLDFVKTLVLVNSSEPSLQLWMNEGGTFFHIQNAFPNSQLIHNGIAVADFDLDGYTDIFVPCVDYGTPEPDSYYNNNRDGTFIQDNTSIPSIVDFTTCISMLDIDNDSKKDIVMACASGSYQVNEGRGLNKLYVNNSGVSNEDPVAVISGVSAFPNPFQSSINISYSVKIPGNIKVEVFNLRGQKVKILENAITQAGRHQCSWDGKDIKGNKLASGVYLYRIQADNQQITKKMVLLK